jgi:hypothetical protein
LSDPINPDHYKRGGIEAIDYLQAKMTPAQFKGYCMGSVLKYVSRAGYKCGNSLEQDLKKARWFLDKLIETEEQNNDGEM